MKKTILIVEDDAKAAKAAKDFFTDKYTCFVANDFGTALNLLKDHTFDFVVTDTFYPQETGSGKRDYVNEIADVLIKEVKWMVENNFIAAWCMDATIKGSQSWISDSDEAVQPMGLWLIKTLFESGYVPENIVLTTNLNHHAELFEPINAAMKDHDLFPLTQNLYLEWPRLHECIQNPTGKHEEWFWKGVYNTLTNS